MGVAGATLPQVAEKLNALFRQVVPLCRASNPFVLSLSKGELLGFDRLSSNGKGTEIETGLESNLASQLSAFARSRNSVLRTLPVEVLGSSPNWVAMAHHRLWENGATGPRIIYK